MADVCSRHHVLLVCESETLNQLTLLWMEMTGMIFAFLFVSLLLPNQLTGRVKTVAESCFCLVFDISEFCKGVTVWVSIYCSLCALLDLFYVASHVRMVD